MSFDYILVKFTNDPMSFAISISILIIALGLFIKLTGNPISFFVNLIKKIGPIAFKELRGKAGRAGVVNIIIVLCLTCLAFVILLKPSITGLFQTDSNANYLFSGVIFLLTVLAFLISLKIVSDNEKYLKLYSKR